MTLAVFTGFARTYYLSAYFGTNATISGGPFSTLVRAHAALFTTWVMLFLLQTSLVATHRVVVHRRLGFAGATLAALMIVVGTATAPDLARRGGTPSGVDPLAFLVIPLGDVAVFALLIVAALLLRRHKEAHKRMILPGLHRNLGARCGALSRRTAPWTALALWPDLSSSPAARNDLRPHHAPACPRGVHLGRGFADPVRAGTSGDLDYAVWHRAAAALTGNWFRPRAVLPVVSLHVGGIRFRPACSPQT